jgi:hypothetical protein
MCWCFSGICKWFWHGICIYSMIQYHITPNIAGRHNWEITSYGCKPPQSDGLIGSIRIRPSPHSIHSFVGQYHQLSQSKCLYSFAGQCPVLFSMVIPSNIWYCMIYPHVFSMFAAYYPQLLRKKKGWYRPAPRSASRLASILAAARSLALRDPPTVWNSRLRNIRDF